MLISVCMATYNGEPYIKEQVDSILSQELEEGHQMEIIVSDDNSTDHTVQLLESYHDDRIKFSAMNRIIATNTTMRSCRQAKTSRMLYSMRLAMSSFSQTKTMCGIQTK